MDKGYYKDWILRCDFELWKVAIHNKNGQGLLPAQQYLVDGSIVIVAIHNKNGQGLLLKPFIMKAYAAGSRNPQ